MHVYLLTVPRGQLARVLASLQAGLGWGRAGLSPETRFSLVEGSIQFLGFGGWVPISVCVPAACPASQEAAGDPLSSAPDFLSLTSKPDGKDLRPHWASWILFLI